MSLSLPPGSTLWYYDFQYKGQRFSNTTGQRDKRKAQAVEKKVRDQAIHDFVARGGTAAPAKATTKPPTLGEAAQAWWDAEGQWRGNKDKARDEKDRVRRLEMAVDFVGRDLIVTDIRTAHIDRAIKRRMARLVRGRMAAPATINRDVIDAIRPVILRAYGVLDMSAPPIQWKLLRMDEPQANPQELSAAEMASIVESLPAHWRDFAHIQERYMARLEEMFFPLSALDLDNAKILLRKRKNGKDHVLYLVDPADVKMLADRKRLAERAGLNTVWFKQRKNGDLVALTHSTACKAMREAMTVSGLRAEKGIKGSHDFRRSGAMRLLRKTGDVSAAQMALGHSTLQATQKYARTSEEALRAALTASISQGPPKSQGPAKIPRFRAKTSAAS